MSAAKPAKQPTTKEPETHNVLYVLCNGDPEDWALARNLPVGQATSHVWVAKVEGVPDELADEISKHGEPTQVWNQLVESCKVTYLQ